MKAIVKNVNDDHKTDPGTGISDIKMVRRQSPPISNSAFFIVYKKDFMYLFL